MNTDTFPLFFLACLELFAVGFPAVLAFKSVQIYRCFWTLSKGHRDEISSSFLPYLQVHAFTLSLCDAIFLLGGSNSIAMDSYENSSKRMPSDQILRHCKSVSFKSEETILTTAPRVWSFEFGEVHSYS